MVDDQKAPITQAVNEFAAGDKPAGERLFVLLYDSFRDLAQRYLRSERADNTLSATDLVHEAFMKLVDQTRVDWRGKTHFMAVGAQVMRRILVDHARSRNRLKRGGGKFRIELDDSMALSPQRDEDVLALEEALAKLSKIDARQATIVEMRFFGGLSVAEVAEVLGVSKRTVESEWTMVRAWLKRELHQEEPTA